MVNLQGCKANILGKDKKMATTQTGISGDHVRDEAISDPNSSVMNGESSSVSAGEAESPMSFVGDSRTAGPTSDQIAVRAYECWHKRGCPNGSPEVDWCRAENEVTSPNTAERTHAASA